MLQPRPFSRLAPRARVALTALAVLVIVGGAVLAATTTLLFREQFEDDPIGAIPGNLATAGQPSITSAPGVITASTFGDRIQVQVTKPMVGSGKALRIGDLNSASSGAHAEVTIRPALKLPGLPYTARFKISRAEGPSELACSIIDNEATPGSGRLGVLALRPDGFFWLGTTKTTTRHEPGHRYQVAMTVTPGPDTTWSVQIVDLETGLQILSVADLPVEDPTAVAAYLEFDTSDVGRGVFDLDDIEISSLGN